MTFSIRQLLLIAFWSIYSSHMYLWGSQENSQKNISPLHLSSFIHHTTSSHNHTPYLCHQSLPQHTEQSFSSFSTQPRSTTGHHPNSGILLPLQPTGHHPCPSVPLQANVSTPWTNNSFHPLSTTTLPLLSTSLSIHQLLQQCSKQELISIVQMQYGYTPPLLSSSVMPQYTSHNNITSLQQTTPNLISLQRSQPKQHPCPIIPLAPPLHQRSMHSSPLLNKSIDETSQSKEKEQTKSLYSCNSSNKPYPTTESDRSSLSPKTTLSKPSGKTTSNKETDYSSQQSLSSSAQNSPKSYAYIVHSPKKSRPTIPPVVLSNRQGTTLPKPNASIPVLSFRPPKKEEKEDQPTSEDNQQQIKEQVEVPITSTPQVKKKRKRRNKRKKQVEQCKKEDKEIPRSFQSTSQKPQPSIDPFYSPKRSPVIQEEEHPSTKIKHLADSKIPIQRKSLHPPKKEKAPLHPTPITLNEPLTPSDKKEHSSKAKAEAISLPLHLPDKKKALQEGLEKKVTSQKKQKKKEKKHPHHPNQKKKKAPSKKKLILKKKPHYGQKKQAIKKSKKKKKSQKSINNNTNQCKVKTRQQDLCMTQEEFTSHLNVSIDNGTLCQIITKKKWNIHNIKAFIINKHVEIHQYEKKSEEYLKASKELSSYLQAILLIGSLMDTLCPRDKRCRREFKNKIIIPIKSLVERIVSTLQKVSGSQQLMSHSQSRQVIHRDFSIFILAANGMVQCMEKEYQKDHSILNLRTSQGRSLFHIATYNSELPMLKWIKSKKADIFERDIDGNSILSLCNLPTYKAEISQEVKAWIRKEYTAFTPTKNPFLNEKQMNMFVSILEKGDFNLFLSFAKKHHITPKKFNRMAFCDKVGKKITPLFFACILPRTNNGPVMLDKLWEWGVNKHARNSEGNNLFMEALFHQPRLLPFLQSHFNIISRNNTGETALHLAARYPKEIFAFCLHVIKEAGINSQKILTSVKCCALSYAALFGQLDNVKMLINEGFDPNGKCTKFLPPVFAALKYNHFPVVFYLLSLYKTKAIYTQHQSRKKVTYHLGEFCIKEKEEERDPQLIQIAEGLLLYYHWDPKALNSKGETYIQQALSCGYEEMYLLLKSYIGKPPTCLSPEQEEHSEEIREEEKQLIP